MTHSPINYPCPQCLSPRGEPCELTTSIEGVWFHNARRAARTAALARASARTPDRRYVRGNLNDGDVTQGHRRTYIDRPDPTLPFEDEGDTLYAAWQEAVKRAVDTIFENQEVQ